MVALAMILVALKRRLAGRSPAQSLFLLAPYQALTGSLV
jgi:hypothetical protein